MKCINQTYFKYISVLLILAALFALWSCSVRLRPLEDSVEGELEKAVEGGFDGIIVYVNQDGKSSYYSAGWKDREKKIPADPHDLFKIASISKLYIAAATSKLIVQQKLSLESKLSQLIPEVKGKIEHADEITLSMLLQHRSGIPEFIYHPDYENSDPEETYLTTAALIFNEAADFSPGKKYRYSNTNYLLIGEILDRTLGYSHHEYIRAELLTPLGLFNTYSLYSEVDSSLLSSGYYVGYEPDLKSLKHTRPGGSMIATAADVGIFLRALIDGTLLNEEEQQVYESVYAYEHTGWLPGYTSIARYHADIDAIVIQFVNTSKGEMYWLRLNRVYNRIVKVVERKE